MEWDAPYGWAPLHWMAVMGLKNYGFNRLADEITGRWLNLVDHVFQQTGKLVEKYNVIDLDRENAGGDYAQQDGYGWTNGVYSALDEIHSE
jgi:alpha,alpha-trehalase